MAEGTHVASTYPFVGLSKGHRISRLTVRFYPSLGKPFSLSLIPPLLVSLLCFRLELFLVCQTNTSFS